jgi:hypothetical protein
MKKHPVCISGRTKVPTPTHVVCLVKNGVEVEEEQSIYGILLSSISPTAVLVLSSVDNETATFAIGTTQPIDRSSHKWAHVQGPQLSTFPHQAFHPATARTATVMLPISSAVFTDEPLL